MNHYETKKYSIAETTKVEREKIANDALSISMLDAKQPSDETMELIKSYIDGKEEISDILKTTINKIGRASCRERV